MSTSLPERHGGYTRGWLTRFWSAIRTLSQPSALERQEVDVKAIDEMNKGVMRGDGIDQVLARKIDRALGESASEVAEPRPPGGEQMRIPLEWLDDNPDQPRQYVDPEYIEELAETILQRGLIHRIV